MGKTPHFCLLNGGYVRNQGKNQHFCPLCQVIVLAGEVLGKKRAYRTKMTNRIEDIFE